MLDDTAVLLEDPDILVLLLFTFLSALLADDGRSGRVLELLLFVILVALLNYEAESLDSLSESFV